MLDPDYAAVWAKQEGIADASFAALAANDAAHHIMSENDLTPDQVRAVDVKTYQAGLTICDNPEPKTPYEAKFSLQFCVANAILRGRVGPSAFTVEALSRIGLAEEAVASAAAAHAIVRERYAVGLTTLTERSINGSMLGWRAEDGYWSHRD